MIPYHLPLFQFLIFNILGLHIEHINFLLYNSALVKRLLYTQILKNALNQCANVKLHSVEEDGGQ
jgi:hypothetical protein